MKLSIIIAFMIFVYMATIKKAFDFGLSPAGDSRLWVRSKTSLLVALPYAHQEQIRNVDGVAKVTHGTFFGAVYKDPEYFDENRVNGSGHVGWFMVSLKDPRKVVAIARAIDNRFANSPHETKTEGEAAMRKGFTNQVADFGAIVKVILSAVFFTILLISGNTMAQSVRERTSELAVMKAVGFTDQEVLAFVQLESMLIAVVGGAMGIAAGWSAVNTGDPTGVLPFFYFPIEQLPVAIAFIVGLGLLAGFLPAVQALRLSAVDALRRE